MEEIKINFEEKHPNKNKEKADVDNIHSGLIEDEKISEIFNKEGDEKSRKKKGLAREKIEIDKNLSVEEIQKKYGVSRATAYRGKKRGLLYPNYHNKIINKDKEWFNKNYEQLQEEVKKAIVKFFHYKGYLEKDIKKVLLPYGEDDLLQHVLYNFYLKSGIPAREDKNWRFHIYYIYITEFLKDNVWGSKQKRKLRRVDLQREPDGKLTEEELLSGEMYKLGNESSSLEEEVLNSLEEEEEDSGEEEKDNNLKEE